MTPSYWSGLNSDARIQDNGTGCDHGSGGTAFVIGGQVRGGLYGEYPSLKAEDHVEGDMHFNNDFRSTYSHHSGPVA